MLKTIIVAMLPLPPPLSSVNKHFPSTLLNPIIILRAIRQSQLTLAAHYTAGTCPALVHTCATAVTQEQLIRGEL